MRKRYLKHDDDAWLADDDTQVEVVEPHPMQIEDDIDIPVSLPPTVVRIQEMN
jgi:hypothetical protein